MPELWTGIPPTQRNGRKKKWKKKFCCFLLEWIQIQLFCWIQMYLLDIYRIKDSTCRIKNNKYFSLYFTGGVCDFVIFIYMNGSKLKGKCFFFSLQGNYIRKTPKSFAHSFFQLYWALIDRKLFFITNCTLSNILGSFSHLSPLLASCFTLYFNNSITLHVIISFWVWTR